MQTNYFKVRLFTISLLTFLLCQFPFLSYAHEGHPLPIEKNVAIEKANEVIAKAVNQQKLAPSWKEAKMEEAKTNDIDEGQWVIKYSNPKITDNNKELFVFLTLDGKYIAMNHTGK